MAFNFDNIPAQPGSAAGEPELVWTIAEMLAAAPRALTLKEVVTVLKDSGIKVPASTTIRGYLNRAAADGRISKPSRQSYAGSIPATVTLDIKPMTEEADPLADL